MPRMSSRVLYVDHVASCGRALFRAVCKHDLEGNVANWTHGAYQTGGATTSWLKIKNRKYSQIVGRDELFALPDQGHRAASR